MRRGLVVVCMIVGHFSSAAVPGPSVLPAAARGLLLDACMFGHAAFAVGERGALIRSDDSGKNWDLVHIPISTTLTAIAFADTQRAWIVGHDGTVLVSNDSGVTWTVQPLPPAAEASLLDVLPLDAHHAVAVGAFGLFLQTADVGRNWSVRKILEEDPHLNRLTRGRGHEFFVAGERGTLLHFADAEAEPTVLATGYAGSFNGIVRLTSGALLAYGLRGHVFRSEDNGVTWAPVAPLPPVLLSAALQLKNGTIILAGQARTFLVSQDDGRSFFPWAASLTTAVADLLEAPDGSLLVFGEGGVNRLSPPAASAAPETR